MSKAMGYGLAEIHIADDFSWLIKADVFYCVVEGGTNLVVS
jgi:hypothetical protein